MDLVFSAVFHDEFQGRSLAHDYVGVKGDQIHEPEARRAGQGEDGDGESKGNASPVTVAL